MAIIKSEEEPLVLGYNPSSILFRVHDELSATQLCDDHGFTATHPDFQSESSGMPISGRVWQKTYQRDYYSSESRDATVESIITHVLGGWPGYAGAYTDDSNWISTTRSLEWAVWEIVRRLVVLGRPYVELSLIDYEGYSKYYKGSRMISEDVAEAIEEYRCDYGLTRSQKMALRFAEASSEVVCFGRIFEKDILAIRLWTERAPGISSTLACMKPFFKPKNERTGNWINWLAFNPYKSFGSAAYKIQKRREQLMGL